MFPGWPRLMGFLLSVVAILLPARNPEISAWGSFLICLYPITETIFSIYRKIIRKGHHPSRPDRVHLHMLVYRGLARKISQKLRIKNYRNPTSSVIMWFFPLTTSVMALITFNNLYQTILMIALTIILYLLIYRKVSLNW